MPSHDELARAVADHERRIRKNEDGIDFLKRAREEDKIEAGRMVESIEKIVKGATTDQTSKMKELETKLDENTRTTESLSTNLQQNTKATEKILIEVTESGKERERRAGAEELRKKLDAERDKYLKWGGGVVGILLTLATIYKIFFH
jgi:uncharacterized protein YeeX (DUF496 family)